MNRHDPGEDTARVVALAASAWAILVAAAAYEGAFAIFTGAEVIAFTVAVCLFAVATCFLDGGLRALLTRVAPARAAAAAGILGAVLAAAIGGGSWPVVAAVAPCAVLATFAAFESLRARSRPRSAAAKPPGGRRAAT